MTNDKEIRAARREGRKMGKLYVCNISTTCVSCSHTKPHTRDVNCYKNNNTCGATCTPVPTKKKFSKYVLAKAIYESMENAVNIKDYTEAYHISKTKILKLLREKSI